MRAQTMLVCDSEDAIRHKSLSAACQRTSAGVVSSFRLEGWNKNVAMSSGRRYILRGPDNPEMLI